jgi:hypothetical protein
VQCCERRHFHVDVTRVRHAKAGFVETPKRLYSRQERDRRGT